MLSEGLSTSPSYGKTSLAMACLNLNFVVSEKAKIGKRAGSAGTKSQNFTHGIPDHIFSIFFFLKSTH